MTTYMHTKDEYRDVEYRDDEYRYECRYEYRDDTDEELKLMVIIEIIKS
jgi:hypothetical protein